MAPMNKMQLWAALLTNAGVMGIGKRHFESGEYQVSRSIPGGSRSTADTKHGVRDLALV
jgi:hypothetical protein